MEVLRTRIMGPIFLLAVVCLFTGCISAEDPDANLVVTRASREVDLTSAVVRQSVTFTFENSGSSSISSFHFVVESSIAPHLAYISAQVSIITLKCVLWGVTIIICCILIYAHVIVCVCLLLFFIAKRSNQRWSHAQRTIDKTQIPTGAHRIQGIVPFSSCLPRHNLCYRQDCFYPLNTTFS